MKTENFSGKEVHFQDVKIIVLEVYYYGQNNNVRKQTFNLIDSWNFSVDIQTEIAKGKGSEKKCDAPSPAGCPPAGLLTFMKFFHFELSKNCF